MSSASQPTRRTGSAPDAAVLALLTARAAMLSRELRDEHRRLNPGGGEHVELSSRLQNARERVDTLLERLREPSVNVAAAGDTLAVERGVASSLFGECFEVAIAPIVRGPDVGRGACEVADLLLCAVALRCGITWPYFTSIAAADSVTSVSNIVRLRYPPSPIWGAAIAVHELGHYCGPNWPGPAEDNPHEKFKTRVKVKDEHREEFFADMFAVYTVGPAFTLACFVRLDPGGPGDAAHPPDAQRAAWILAGLEALAGSTDGKTADILRMIAGRCRGNWDALCRVHGQPVDPDALATLTDEGERLFAAFRRSRPDAMYADVGGALGVRASYADPSVRGVMPHPVDVLNGAWFLRLDAERAGDTDAAGRIERWGGELIRGFQCP